MRAAGVGAFISQSFAELDFLQALPDAKLGHRDFRILSASTDRAQRQRQRHHHGSDYAQGHEYIDISENGYLALNHLTDNRGAGSR